MKHFTALSAVAALVIAAPAFAGPVVSGFNSNSFPANDDGATGAINLGFTANFFGVLRTQTYVSNNGYVTFNSGQGTYTPYGLAAGYVGQPIIAAYFADVDTRGSASSLVTYGTGTFDGHDTFGVNYVDVGYYPAASDKLNSFQILLVNRADISTGDFDIYFNYDEILWETGSASGGSNGFGGVSASAGFNAGTGTAGTYYQLPGSLVNGALIDGGSNSLTANSNMGVAGRYLFAVRNGQVITPPVSGAVPEPATWAMMIGGLAFAGASLRRRRVAISFA